MKEFKPNFLPAAIGSLPHRDVARACSFVLDNFNQMPFWPQLPKASFNENMYVQFSQGLDAFVIDGEAKKIYLDRSDDVSAAIEKLYEHFLSEDIDYFKISEDFARGFYALVRLLKERPKEIKFIKGQMIGPVSFGLSVTDEARRALIYDSEVMSALVKLLVMKARWQARRLEEFARTVIFLDEPYLTSVDSAYTLVKKDDIIKWLNEIIDALHLEGALTGIHCCGNTDWPLLLKTKVDIVNFDAYNYSEAISLYPRDIDSFLARGGVLAWGIVPTSAEELEKEDLKSMQAKLAAAFGLLEKKGIERNRLVSQGIVTPSCGTGLLSEELAEKAHLLTCEIAKRKI